MSCGRIGQSVLIAGLFGDAGVELFHGGALGGEVDVAAGIVSVVHQAAEAALEIGAADGHAVDGDVVAQQFLDGFFIAVGVGADAVGSIGDQENNFAAFAAAIFQELGGAVDSVVEGLGALPFDLVYAAGDLRSVAGGGVAVDGGADCSSRGGGATEGSVSMAVRLIWVSSTS